MKNRYVKLIINKSKYDIESITKNLKCLSVKYVDEDYLRLNNVYFYVLNREHYYSYYSTPAILVVYFDLKFEHKIKNDPSYIAFRNYEQEIRKEKIKRLIK